MSISVIIPTIGRETLVDAVMSVECLPGDEIILVSDGHNVAVEETARALGARYGFVGPTGHSGAEQRDLGIRMARGTWVAFIDDDDVMAAGAMERFRRAIYSDPIPPRVFRMRYGDASQSPGLLLYREETLALCNVGTPMFLVPRAIAARILWAGAPDHRYHDHWWINRINEIAPVKFEPDVVAIIRP